MRKIDAMYAHFGRDYEHKCKECCNCVAKRYSKTYHKCLRYGESNAISTDWVINQTACGMFDVPLHDGEYPMIKRLHKIREPEVAEGQIRIDELTQGKGPAAISKEVKRV